jgi:hypothetical protein
LPGGEISPSLYGRIDLEKYQTSLRRCRNFIVRQSGGIENRPGFRFLGSAKYADRYCRLIPFQFSVSQTYALELGDHYFRVWSNGALVTDGGSPVEVATPWPVSVISELKFTQSADVMTVCHNNYPPLEIRRYGEADWRRRVTTTSGPFQDLNTDDSVTVYASGRTGSVTLTASSIFKSYHVGKLFYMEQKAVDSVGRWVTGERQRSERMSLPGELLSLRQCGERHHRHCCADAYNRRFMGWLAGLVPMASSGVICIAVSAFAA